MRREVEKKLENVFSFSSLACLKQGNNYQLLSCTISRALLLTCMFKDWFALCHQLSFTPQPHWREKLAGPDPAWCFRNTDCVGPHNLSSSLFPKITSFSALSCHLNSTSGFISAPAHPVIRLLMRRVAAPLCPTFMMGNVIFMVFIFLLTFFFLFPPQFGVTPSAWDNSCRALLLLSSLMPQTYALYKEGPCFDTEMGYLDRAWRWAGGIYEERLKEDLSLQLILIYCPTSSSLWSWWRAFPDFNVSQTSA